MKQILLLLATLCVARATDYATSSMSKTYVSTSKAKLSMDLLMSVDDNRVTLTLVGPSSVYYSVGFGTSHMDGAYCIVVDGEGKLSERKLDGKTAGDELHFTWDIDSNIVEDKYRTVVLSREYDFELLSTDYFEFKTSDSKIETVWAYGTTSELDNHGEDKRGSKKLSTSRIAASTISEKTKINMFDAVNSETEKTIGYDDYYSYYSGYLTVSSLLTWITCIALFGAILYFIYRKWEKGQYEPIPDNCQSNISMVDLTRSHDIDNDERFTVV